MDHNATYTYQIDTSQFQNGRERVHYVYLIKRADGPIKVGVSTNVQKRLSDLAQAFQKNFWSLRPSNPANAT
jgi:hypothetical protein